MITLSLSAAFVGLVHSLAPGHWLPIVLMAKTRRWNLKTAVLGATIAALGHILLSTFLGLCSIWVGVLILAKYETEVEKYAGLALALFGLLFAGNAYFRHSHCHGHSHHGPDPRGKRAPFLFLFTLGFSPCIAVLPVFVAATAEGPVGVGVVLVSFAIGVIAALVSATLLVTLGLLKLDHPLFEHYGDVVTGLGVAGMGVLLFLYSG